MESRSKRHLLKWQTIVPEDLGIIAADYVVLVDVDVNVRLAHSTDAHFG